MERSQRRNLASVVTTAAAATDESSASGTKVYQSVFAALLAAVQREDLPGTTSAFLRWVHRLDVEWPDEHAYLKRFRRISSPVMSEILRALDPLRHRDHDVLHSLAIGQGSLLTTKAGKYIDEVGVRRHHRLVAEGVEKVLVLLDRFGMKLKPADIDVVMRILGACTDYAAAPKILDMRKNLYGTNWGTSVNWLEFLRTRFLADPANYQYDRGRVLIKARQRVDHNAVVNETQAVRDLDRIRYSINHLQREPWNRRSDDLEVDLSRLLRLKNETYSGFTAHWLRCKFLGVDVTTEFLSVSMVGFARSDNRQGILNHILRDSYGVEVDDENQTITGGLDLPADSPIYPTESLQNAIVEAFCVMGDVSLAMQLVDFISRRYSIPISPKVWSNLLSWTFVCASKSNKVYNRIWTSPNASAGPVRVSDVLHVWKLMTSPPYNIKPSFEDMDTYIRACIIAHKWQDALHALRTSAVPFYDAATQELAESVADEALLQDCVGETIPRPEDAPATNDALNAARHRREKAAAHQDFIKNCISRSLVDLLKTSSKSLHARRNAAVSVPDTLHEFGSFILVNITYRTMTGRVDINTSPDQRSKAVGRNALVTRLGGPQVRAMKEDKHGNPRMVQLEPEEEDNVPGKWVLNPQFEWPHTHEMRIVENTKSEAWRRRKSGQLPLETDGQVASRVKWWCEVKRELSG